MSAIENRELNPAALGLPEQAISVRGLTKTYRGDGKSPPKTALSGVDLDIPRGSLFGLLGPNEIGRAHV